MVPDYYKNTYLRFKCKLNKEFEEFILNDFKLQDDEGNLYRHHFLYNANDRKEIDYKLKELKHNCEQIRYYGGEFKLDFDQARAILEKEFEIKYSLENILKEIFSNECIFVDDDKVIFEIKINREPGYYLFTWKDDEEHQSDPKIPDDKIIDFVKDGVVVKNYEFEYYLGKNWKLYLIDCQKVIESIEC